MDSEVFYSIAMQTGDYYMDKEWEDVTRTASNIDTSSFDSFFVDIKKHQYYNLVVLFNKGDDELIRRQLESDYEEIKMGLFWDR
jgi:hypothetical protein